MNGIKLEPLDGKNWLKVCSLSVSQEQKRVFPISNVYWIGISRYQEYTELLAIKQGDDYAGLIGLGFDEDGASGFINPLMVDQACQRRGVGEQALRLAAQYLRKRNLVKEIHIRHRRENKAAGRLYEKLGFLASGGNDTEIFGTLKLEEDTHADCRL